MADSLSNCQNIDRQEHHAELHQEPADRVRDVQHSSGMLTVILAKHTLNNPADNYALILHGLAYHVVWSSDHLCHQFFNESVTELGAKLALLSFG